VTEYKQIAEELEKEKVLSPGNATLLRTLAGHRNRMVHLYDDISPKSFMPYAAREMVLAYRELGKEIPLGNALIEQVPVHVEHVGQAP